MISKIALSVVKRNLPIMKCVGMMDKYKIIHSFSDNNKKSNFIVLFRSFLEIQKRLIPKTTSKELRNKITKVRAKK